MQAENLELVNLEKYVNDAVAQRKNFTCSMSSNINKVLWRFESSSALKKIASSVFFALDFDLYPETFSVERLELLEESKLMSTINQVAPDAQRMDDTS